MRIFVSEYLSNDAAGAIGGTSSLLREGWAMLSAVLADFARCPGVEVATLVNPRLRSAFAARQSGVAIHFSTAETEEDAFRNLAATADFTLVIAPEFDGILAHRCALVEEAGGRLLGPSVNAIRWSADKVAVNQHLEARQIPVPRSSSIYPAVCKPRFGAGSIATFLVHNEDEWSRAQQQARAEGWHGELIRQPYTAGLPASVAILAGPREWRTLPAVEQRLSTDGRFRYLGGRLPLPPHLDRRARVLAERAAHTVEGWRGWLGVDLVLGDAEDGSGDVVIEINPRLTTSYVGLRRLARFNLAETMLAAVTGTSSSPWTWHPGPLEFSPQDAVVDFPFDASAVIR